jgi:hypothetical protein
VRIDPGLSAVLFGQPTAVTVRTYRLSELPGAATMVAADWVVLLGLLALSWSVPRWRRRLVGITVVVLGVLLLLTLGLGQTAVQASGSASDYPTAELLAGAWLALLGACIIGVAVAVPAATAKAPVLRPNGEAATSRADLGNVATPDLPTVAAEQSQEPAGAWNPAAGWSVRPVWQPWWRRRGPRVALLAGIAAAALAAGTAVWLAVDVPPAADGHSGLRRLVLPAPPGSTRAAFNGQTIVSGMDGGPLVAQRSDVRQVAFGGWEPSGQDRLGIALLQLASDDEARRTLALFFMQSRLSDQHLEDVPGVPDAQSFGSGSQVDVVGQRGDVIYIIVYAGPDATASVVNTLAKRQYDLL